MRTSKRDIGRGVAACAALALVLLASSGKMEEATRYGSAIEAFRTGEKALAAKHIEAAVPAFEYAANRGVLGAQLRLARLYRAGQEVERDDTKALAYYRMLADQYAEIDPLHPAASYVAEAFRVVAQYYQTGIDSISLRPNPGRAARLLSQAASYFRDPIAQYELAKLYLSGEGVPKNPDIALNWLVSAAKKKYAPAQALLGDLLWQGKEVGQRRARGLALLAIAADNAGDKDRAWIVKLYESALDGALDDEMAAAEKFVAGLSELRSSHGAAPIVLARRADLPRLSGNGLIVDHVNSLPAIAVEDVAIATVAEASEPKDAKITEGAGETTPVPFFMQLIEPSQQEEGEVEIQLYHGESTGISLRDIGETVAVAEEK